VEFGRFRVALSKSERLGGRVLLHLLMATQSDPVVAWIDGSCDLCLGARTWVEERDRAGAVRFQDFRSCAVQSLPRAPGEHEEALWVRSEDGALHRGYDAVLTLLRTLPRWRWLVPLAGWPPVRWLGDRIYAVVARRRRRSP
jgi:predicted DCC family thiol-disulfide oxidoreductase YuxK